MALAVFASDAISSTAYATEEILLVLMVGGGVPEDAQLPGADRHRWRSSCWSSSLTSYRQTIHAYPNGGGAYVVSRRRTSTPTAGLVAGASLLVDYTLTVAVSISVGRARHRARRSVTSRPDDRPGRALPRLPRPHDRRQPARPQGGGQGLRGPDLRLRRAAVLAARRRPHPGLRVRPRPDRDLAPSWPTSSPRSTTLRRRSAVAVRPAAGVLVRRRRAVGRRGHLERRARLPQARVEERRRRTLTLHGAHPRRSASSGIGVLAHHLLPVVDEGGETVLSQMGKAVFGETPIYYAFQFATFAILILAANTAFAGFPQLSSIIARDGYLPRQLANRGDRLVFSNGILVLSGMAALLIVAFRAEVSALIPLYAVGVFTGFTLSQFGMVRHHRRAAGTEVAAGPRHQRGRLRRHRHRARRRRRLEVHRGRLDPGGGDPDDRAALPGHPPALRAGRLRAQARAAATRPGGAPTPSSCSSAGSQGRARVDRLRPLAPPRPAHRRVGGVQRRGAGAHHQGVGGPRHPRRAAHACTRRSASCSGRSCGSSTSSTPRSPTTSSPSSCPSSCSTTGGSRCCTTRAPCCCAPACGPGRTRSSRRCRSTCRAAEVEVVGPTD